MAIKIVENVREPHLLITHVTLGSQDSTESHKHPETNEYYKILSGQGKLRLGGQEFSAKTGDFFIIPAGTSHQIWHDGQELLPLEFMSIKDSSEDDTVPA